MLRKQDGEKVKNEKNSSEKKVAKRKQNYDLPIKKEKKSWFANKKTLACKTKNWTETKWKKKLVIRSTKFYFLGVPKVGG